MNKLYKHIASQGWWGTASPRKSQLHCQSLCKGDTVGSKQSSICKMINVATGRDFWELRKNFVQIMNEKMRSEFRKRSLWPNGVNRQETGGGKTQPAGLPCQPSKVCPLPLSTLTRPSSTLLGKDLHGQWWRWGCCRPWNTFWSTAAFLCPSDAEWGTRRPFEEHSPEPNYASWSSLINNER